MIEGIAKRGLSTIEFSGSGRHMNQMGMIFQNRLVIHSDEVGVIPVQILLVTYKIWRCHVSVQQMGLDVYVLDFLVLIGAISINESVTVREYQFLHLWRYTRIVARSRLLSGILFGWNDLIFRNLELFVVPVLLLLSVRWDVRDDFSDAGIAIHLRLYRLKLRCPRWFVGMVPSIMNLLRPIFESGLSCHLPFRPGPFLIPTTSRIALSFPTLKESIRCFIDRWRQRVEILLYGSIYFIKIMLLHLRI